MEAVEGSRESAAMALEWMKYGEDVLYYETGV